MKNQKNNTLRPVINCFYAIEKIQRSFHPSAIDYLKEKLHPYQAALEETETYFPEFDDAANSTIKDIVNLIDESIDLIMSASNKDFQRLLKNVMKAFRKFYMAQERLFHIRKISESADRFFWEPGIKIISQPMNNDAEIINIGSGNDPYGRGIYSIFIPDIYSSSKAFPLIISLHGGYSHGKDILWSWLREARSRGYILASPTSTGKTWSITDPEVDIKAILQMLEKINCRWNIDNSNILLTGLSDGGTFTLACAMEKDFPIKGYVPIASTMPYRGLENLSGKNIYRIHGALDWMFPIGNVEKENGILESVGANIIFRKIENLSHTYPREENNNILNWFNSI